MKTALSTRPGAARNERIGATRIVVGVDGTDTARAAAARAGVIADALDADLHVVTCATPTMSTDIRIGGDHFHTDWVQEARALLDDVIATVPCRHVASSVGEGDPADVLCEEADRLGAELIVVGNRRVQGVSRVLGSVASSVTRRAGCDVLVVHTTA